MDAKLPTSVRSPSGDGNPFGLLPGDVLGFSSRDCTGFWVNAGTLGVPFWSLSHLAIVADHPWAFTLTFPRPSPIVWESTTLYRQPCLLRGRMTSGVQAHGLVQRIHGYNGRVWRYPLAWELGHAERQRLLLWLESQLGRRYDLLGAWRARDLCLGRMRRWLIGRKNLRSLFCSELVAAALAELGIFRDDNPSAWSPNRLGRELRRRGLCRSPIRLK